jgi:hypothetical protein
MTKDSSGADQVGGLAAMSTLGAWVCPRIPLRPLRRRLTSGSHRLGADAGGLFDEVGFVGIACLDGCDVSRIQLSLVEGAIGGGLVFCQVASGTSSRSGFRQRASWSTASLLGCWIFFLRACALAGEELGVVRFELGVALFQLEYLGDAGEVDALG